jgi:hypothetical protein
VWIHPPGSNPGYRYAERCSVMFIQVLSFQCFVVATNHVMTMTSLHAEQSYIMHWSNPC